LGGFLNHFDTAVKVKLSGVTPVEPGVYRFELSFSWVSLGYLKTWKLILQCGTASTLGSGLAISHKDHTRWRGYLYVNIVFSKNWISFQFPNKRFLLWTEPPRGKVTPIHSCQIISCQLLLTLFSLQKQIIKRIFLVD